MPTFLLIQEDYVTEAVQELSDKHDEVVDDDPEYAMEIDALCGRLNEGSTVEHDQVVNVTAALNNSSFMPTIAVTEVKESLGTILERVEGLISATLPDGGLTSDESQKVFVLNTLMKVSHAINGLTAADLAPHQNLSDVEAAEAQKGLDGLKALAASATRKGA